MDNNKHNSTGLARLSPLQKQVATMLASGMSISTISSDLELNRTTIYNWLGIDEFAKSVDSLQDELFKTIKAELFCTSIKAIKAIGVALDSPDECVRTKTAMWLLDDVKHLIRRDMCDLLTSKKRGG